MSVTLVKEQFNNKPQLQLQSQPRTQSQPSDSTHGPASHGLAHSQLSYGGHPIEGQNLHVPSTTTTHSHVSQWGENQ
jgi:hypothetical protein